MVVDGIGNPVYFQLSSGNLHDSTLAVDVLSNIDITGSNILGDKAYGTNEIRQYIDSKEAFYTIPPKSNSLNPWHCDWWVYSLCCFHFYFVKIVIENIVFRHSLIKILIYSFIFQLFTKTSYLTTLSKF